MLAVSQMRCCYGDIVAVESLDLSVGSGEILGLVGANGAGKTSTILALAGLVPLQSGTVSINGTDITSLPPHRRIDSGIALVPEGRRVFPDLTVVENLAVGGMRLDKTAWQQNQQRVMDIFPRLAERHQQLAGSLSGGEQQMLAIGRALMAQPRLLLVDELSLGLMPIAIDECYRVLQSLRDEQIATIIVEQSTERILDVSDHIVVLESGRPVWRGTGDNAKSDTAVFNAYMGL